MISQLFLPYHAFGWVSFAACCCTSLSTFLTWHYGLKGWALSAATVLMLIVAIMVVLLLSLNENSVGGSGMATVMMGLMGLYFLFIHSAISAFGLAIKSMTSSTSRES